MASFGFVVFLLCCASSLAAYIKLPVELVDGAPLHDTIAQSACVGLATEGWVFAVRRTCAAGSPLCSEICMNPALKAQDSEVSSKTASCINSLHIDTNRPTFDPDYTKDIAKLGPKVYRYNSCTWASCGPNYCCCRFM